MRRAPLAQRRQTLLVNSCKRRRWESNPLQAALQAAAAPSGSSVNKHPRQESDLVLDLRGVACESGTPRGHCTRSISVPRRAIEPRLADSKSAVPIRHTRKAQVARPGIEPGLAASEAGVRSGTLTGHSQPDPDLESNQDLNFRTVPCGPLHYRDMEPTAGFAPASIGVQNRCLTVRPRRQARARGVEPRPPVLEAGCSPRSTLV